jgi:hypothetical protein
MVMQIKSSDICSRQLLRNVLVEDFLHGQGHDDLVANPTRGISKGRRISHLLCKDDRQSFLITGLTGKTFVCR